MARDSGNGEHGRDRADSYLITGAESSLEDQHKERIRRYTMLMSIRIPALIIASVVYVQTHNAWWAVGIIVLSIPIPWIAVLIANDRPARKKGEVQYYRYGPGRTVGPPEITEEPAPPAEPVPDDPRVIEAHLADDDIPDADIPDGQTGENPAGTDSDDPQ